MIAAKGSRAPNGRRAQIGRRRSAVDRAQSDLVAISGAHDGAQFADAVDQTALCRHVPGQHVAVEQAFVGAIDLAGAAPTHMLLERPVDVLLQTAQSLDIGRVRGQERIEQRFVRAGGIEAPLDAEPLDQLR